MAKTNDWAKQDAARVEALRVQRAAEREARRAEWQRNHAAQLEQRRHQKAQARSLHRARWQAEHAEDYLDSDERHAQDMAGRLGMNVVDFKELQQQRRAETQNKPKITYSPDHEVR